MIQVQELLIILLKFILLSKIFAFFAEISLVTDLTTKRVPKIVETRVFRVHP